MRHIQVKLRLPLSSFQSKTQRTILDKTVIELRRVTYLVKLNSRLFFI